VSPRRSTQSFRGDEYLILTPSSPSGAIPSRGGPARGIVARISSWIRSSTVSRNARGDGVSAKKPGYRRAKVVSAVKTPSPWTT
jgi:hypothetical protein